MSNLFRFVAVLPVALLLSLDPSPAQEEPQARFAERIMVTEVLLDVIVTDAQGNVVVGLDKSDFLLEVQGEEVELSGAVFYSNQPFLHSSAVAQQLGLSNAPVPDFRYFIVLFHDRRQDLAILAGRQLDAARWVQRWVEEEILANDLVAVASYDFKLKIHQDFTNDKERILQGIQSAATGKDPSKKGQPDGQPRGGGPSLLENLPQGRELRRQTTRIYDGLRLLAEASRAIIGRKNLLFFSIGFGEVDEAGFYTPDVRYYPPMMQALNDSNIAVYPIDLIPSSRGGGSLDRRLNDSLSGLAFDTGGRYYYTFSNFLTPLRQVTQENSGYYLLSYSAEFARGTSGYREVKITTRNPKLNVQARKGYLYGP